MEDSTTLAQPKPRIECPIVSCPKTYAHKGDMLAHMACKHPEQYRVCRPMYYPPKSSRTDKPFGCPVATCPCGYKTLCLLQRHVKAKHPERITTSKKWIVYGIQ